MATELDERTYTDEKLDVSDNGDHDMFSHYVKKDAIVDASVYGTEVIAICGKVWIPGRDPKKFPLCPTCKDIYENVLK